MEAPLLDSRAMEHRWGERTRAAQRVELQIGRGVGAAGVLRDASLSGAYITTSVPLNRDQRVELELRSPVSLTLAGYVVRIDQLGIGLEWEEFASDPVRALLSSLSRRA